MAEESATTTRAVPSAPYMVAAILLVLIAAAAALWGLNRPGRIDYGAYINQVRGAVTLRLNDHPELSVQEAILSEINRLAAGGPGHSDALRRLPFYFNPDRAAWDWELQKDKDAITLVAGLPNQIEGVETYAASGPLMVGTRRITPEEAAVYHAQLTRLAPLNARR